MISVEICSALLPLHLKAASNVLCFLAGLTAICSGQTVFVNGHCRFESIQISCLITASGVNVLSTGPKKSPIYPPENARRKVKCFFKVNQTQRLPDKKV